MVIDKKVVFEVSDITNVIISCLECDGEVMSPLDSKYKLPDNCPYCDANWRRSDKKGAHGILLEEEFIRTIRALLRQCDSPTKLRFEISCNDEKAKERSY